MEIKTPWYTGYGKVKKNIDYPQITMCEQIVEVSKRQPSKTALSFMGKNTSYANMV